MIAGIAMISPTDEGDDMTLQELQKKSTAELRDMFNDLTKKNLKRFADRTEAERRTAAALDDAKQWTGPLPGAAKAKGTKPTGKVTKAAKPAANVAKLAKESKAKRAPGAGRPQINARYVPIPETSKNFNPKGLRINPKSARNIVLEFIKSSKDGATRDQIETKFANNEDLNVTSALGFLKHYGFVTAQG